MTERQIGLPGVIVSIAVIIAALVFVLNGCKDAPAPPPDVPVEPNGTVIDRGMTQEEIDLVTAHNNYRKQNKLAFLESNPKLNAAAQGHAKWMADNNKMSHTGKNGSTLGQRLKVAGYKYGYAGENIAAGYKTVDAVMNGWKKSPGHNNNMLNKNYTQIGVAVANAKNGQRFWCVDLGRPLASGATVQEVPEENLPGGLSFIE